ncbi:fasciclin domain-containing protein [Spirosoma fluminis]
MKIKQIIVPLALQVGLFTTVSWAQTTPPGTATPSSYPIGAVAPDSASGAKASRSQKRAMKREQNRMKQNARGTSASSTSPSDGQYRESATSNGTAVNNSNTTNYNSNNVTNAPTGAGSNPNATATPGGSGSGTSVSTSGTTTRSDINSGAPKTGTAAAVTGARMTEEPAVKAGSTVRNTSIGDFIASSPNYVTLQNALQSAEMDQTLKGSGPYTLFAPSNSAFKKLPTTVQGSLLEGRNRDALKQLLSYHVVSGSVSAAELTQQIKAGNGKAQLKTLAGATLTAQIGSNDRVTLTDEQGNTATVEDTDQKQMNGVVHGISSVLMPKGGTSAFR